MADIHLHFNWDQQELHSAQYAVDKLKQHNVVLASVSSVPSDFALKLRQAGGDWIIPFVSPYYHAGNRLNWYFDPEVITEVRKRLETGQYKGIGEVHLSTGVGQRRDNKVFLGLLQLAREYEVPVLIHTDAGDYRYFLPICKNNQDIRFLWAHAGGVLQPVDLIPLLDACANVWVDMSARDDWHYGYFIDDKNHLPDAWRALFIRYPDRFMVGTDPVWNAHQIYRWYEADEGWQHYEKMHDFHRNWMKQLPPEVEKKIRLTNAQRFFGHNGRLLD